LPHLPDDLESLGEGRGIAILLEPQVESLQRRIPVVDEAAAELAVVHHVDRADQPVVVEAAHLLELMARDHFRHPALGVRGVGEETDARRSAGLLAGGLPVLPALTLRDRTALDDRPRADLALAPLDQTDLLQQMRENRLLVRADQVTASHPPLEQS